MLISLPSHSDEAKMKQLKPAECYIPSHWGKNPSHLLLTEISGVISSVIKVAL